jgi:hypothetical protein
MTTLEELDQMVLDLDKRFGPGPSIEKWFQYEETIKPLYTDIGRARYAAKDIVGCDEITVRLDKCWNTLLPLDRFTLMDLLRYHAEHMEYSDEHPA